MGAHVKSGMCQGEQPISPEFPHALFPLPLPFVLTSISDAIWNMDIDMTDPLSPRFPLNPHMSEVFDHITVSRRGPIHPFIIITVITAICTARGWGANHPYNPTTTTTSTLGFIAPPTPPVKRPLGRGRARRRELGTVPLDVAARELQRP